MAKHLIVAGRVQGVGYRAWFLQQARALGLRGWVRNRRDGSVEAMVAGTREAIEQLVSAAHRGPPAARVTQVRLSDLDDDAVREPDFDVRGTE